MIHPDGTTEADIVINGVPLTFAQSMTLRVAIASFCYEMRDNPDSLGTDEHGRFMHKAYWARASEIQRLILLNQPSR